MLTIRYKNNSPMIETWEEQLEALVIAHQMIQDDTIEVLTLKNASETITGEKAISKYIDDLAIFQTAWFSCSCG